MDIRTVRVSAWSGSAPTIEDIVIEGRPFYRRLTYRNQLGGRIEVAAMPKLPTVDLGNGGILATSLDDAMRLAVMMGVEIANERGGDPDALRRRARALMQNPTEPTAWRPTDMTVDGDLVNAAGWAIDGEAWAMVAELPDEFVALSGSAAMAPTAISLATEITT
jgi:hypothetical protein